MSIEVGAHVWIPCDVKPGPFSGERLVWVKSSNNDWVGFVPTTFLKDPIEIGKTEIKGIVIGYYGANISIEMPGEAIANSIIQSPTLGVSPA